MTMTLQKYKLCLLWNIFTHKNWLRFEGIFEPDTSYKNTLILWVGLDSHPVEGEPGLRMVLLGQSLGREQGRQVSHILS